MLNKPLVWSAVLLSGVSLLAAAGGQSATTLAGYSPARSAVERDVEARFATIPSADQARTHHRMLTSEPHPAGSARNNELAEDLAALWKAQGWEDVTVRRYDVLQSAPRRVALEMVAPVPYRASLREDAYPIDPDTANPEVSGGWLAFSASGEVTAPLVYANSGNPADYALLREHGIDVSGKIVIVRYSNPYSYRGFKALTAQREGAAALLIYSDPAEDGYAKGPVYPDGPWGPESHIQRGSITYDFIVPGDPLTPGWASLPGTRRIAREDAQSLPNIIAVPLSWRDARPLLEQMDGPEAPEAWRGALPITYRLGGERVRVHVDVDLDTSVVPNYVVEAKLRGTEFPDEWIVLGNHRDAWVYGGVDPSSGTASQMELTRALGALKQAGIRPRRTIVVCSWDGEEHALTGSTEWGEHFASELTEKAVVYINVDSSTSGPNFQPTAVPSLSGLIVDVSRTLDDPSGRSLYEAWRASAAAGGSDVPDGRLVDNRIGSGSDHTVFLNRLGVPSVLLEFDGPYGVYHSVYDSHDWMSRIGDPGFRYHRLMSQLWGVLALRLANADVVPYDFAAYAAGVRSFIDALAEAQPALESQVSLDGVRAELDAFEAAGQALRASTRRALEAGTPDSAALQAVNERLRRVERNWLHPEGIPGRPWFRHLLYAARYTYAHLELPGLTEAAEAGSWQLAREQLALLEAAIAKNTALVNDAAARLGRTDW
jgi:N-acetylated-alpha-linked acidic dipeptidase